MKEQALKLADFIEKHMVEFGLILGEVSRDHIVGTIRKLVAELEYLEVHIQGLTEEKQKLVAELDKLKGDGEVCGGCGAIRYDPICEPSQTKPEGYGKAVPLSDEEIMKEWEKAHRIGKTK